MNTDKPTTRAAQGQNVRVKEWRKWLKGNGTSEMVWPFNMWEQNREFSFTEKEKEAACIVDQLCPVITHETGQFVGPKLFKALTLRLTELL